jgi:hypothetical protein
MHNAGKKYPGTKNENTMTGDFMKRIMSLMIIGSIICCAGVAQAMEERERYFNRYHQYPVENVIAATPGSNQPSALAPAESFQPNFVRQEPTSAKLHDELVRRQKSAATAPALPTADIPAAH